MRDLIRVEIGANDPVAAVDVTVAVDEDELIDLTTFVLGNDTEFDPADVLSVLALATTCTAGTVSQVGGDTGDFVCRGCRPGPPSGAALEEDDHQSQKRRPQHQQQGDRVQERGRAFLQAVEHGDG